MLVQGVAILFIPFFKEFYQLAIISTLLGLGTALVYPTFLSTIAQATTPNQRAESIGTFRLWRDLGYAIGAIISGITADLFGVNYAIVLIGCITILSSIIIEIRMPKKIKIEKECIEVDEVKLALQQNKKIQIIDVRSKEEFKINHIPNAINIALTELQFQLNLLNKDYQIITVCGKGGGRSSEAAKILKELGFKAHWLCGGTNKWLNINK
jgi:rhodanese-related sulfurtransferase